MWINKNANGAFAEKLLLISLCKSFLRYGKVNIRIVNSSESTVSAVHSYGRACRDTGADGTWPQVGFWRENSPGNGS